MRHRFLILQIIFLSILISCYKIDESNISTYSELDCHISNIQSSNGVNWSYLYNSYGQLIKYGSFDLVGVYVYNIQRDSNLQIKFFDYPKTSISTYTRHKDTIKCNQINTNPNDTLEILYILDDNLIKYCKYSDKFGNSYIDTFEYIDNNLMKYKNSKFRETYTYEYFNSSFFIDTIGNKIYKINNLLTIGESDAFIIINDYFKLNCNGKNLGKINVYINSKLENTFELFKNKKSSKELYFFTNIIHKYSRIDTSIINLSCY